MRILRCINFRKGESSPNNFLNVVVNLYLIKSFKRRILNERTFYSFILLFESEPLPKINKSAR